MDAARAGGAGDNAETPEKKRRRRPTPRRREVGTTLGGLLCPGACPRGTAPEANAEVRGKDPDKTQLPFFPFPGFGHFAGGRVFTCDFPPTPSRSASLSPYVVIAARIGRCLLCEARELHFPPFLGQFSGQRLQVRPAGWRRRAATLQVAVHWKL